MSLKWSIYFFDQFCKPVTWMADVQNRRTNKVIFWSQGVEFLLSIVASHSCTLYTLWYLQVAMVPKVPKETPTNKSPAIGAAHGYMVKVCDLYGHRGRLQQCLIVATPAGPKE